MRLFPLLISGDRSVRSSLVGPLAIVKSENGGKLSIHQSGRIKVSSSPPPPTISAPPPNPPKGDKKSQVFLVSLIFLDQQSQKSKN